MIWQVWVIGIGLPLIAAFFLYNYFNKRGQKVKVNVWRIIKGKLFLTNQKKYIIGTIVNEDGVPKIYLPKKYSKFPQKSPLSDDYVPNTDGEYIVNLLKVGEDQFTPINWSYDVDAKQMNIESMDADVAYWLQNAIREAEFRNKVEDKWGWLKNTATIGIVAIVCAAMIFYAIDKSSDIASATIEEAKNTKIDILGAVQKFSNPTASESNNKAETSADKPPGQG